MYPALAKFFTNELHPYLHASPLSLQIVLASVIFHALLYWSSDLCFFRLKCSGNSGNKLMLLLLRQPAGQDYKTNRMNWNSRVVSNFHALIVLMLCIVVLMDMDGSGLMVHQRIDLLTPMSHFICCYSAGYFIYDLALIIVTYPHLGGLGMVTHHLMGIVTVWVVCSWQSGAFFYCAFGLTELTTFFVNLRWFLEVLDKKQSKAFVVNGALMWLTWTIARIPPVVLVPKVFWDNHKLLFSEFPPFVTLVCVVNYVLISILNLYWWWRISAGLVKHLSIYLKQKKKKTSKRA